jgi:RNA polymerase sigma-70 factor (ECF subfamily)
MTDTTLIADLRRGDRAAFERVILAHQHAIHAYLRSRLLRTDDADDLVQEVFLRFYLARARFDEGQMLRPWLLGIARNLLREHARKHRRRKEVAWTELCLELEDLMVHHDAPEQDALRGLPECLESLGESARDAIHMHYARNLKLSEIGEKLRRSEGAVKLLVFRARQALKRCLTRKLTEAT